jgi:hypothetical protein
LSFFKTPKLQNNTNRVYISIKCLVSMVFITTYRGGHGG